MYNYIRINPSLIIHFFHAHDFFFVFVSNLKLFIVNLINSSLVGLIGVILIKSVGWFLTRLFRLINMHVKEVKMSVIVATKWLVLQFCAGLLHKTSNLDISLTSFEKLCVWLIEILYLAFRLPTKILYNILCTIFWQSTLLWLSCEKFVE